MVEWRNMCSTGNFVGACLWARYHTLSTTHVNSGKICIILLLSVHCYFSLHRSQTLVLHSILCSVCISFFLCYFLDAFRLSFIGTKVEEMIKLFSPFILPKYVVSDVVARKESSKWFKFVLLTKQQHNSSNVLTLTAGFNGERIESAQSNIFL